MYVNIVLLKEKWNIVKNIKKFKDNLKIKQFVD